MDSGDAGISSAHKAIEQSIIYKWDSLEPQAEDKLFQLDIDSLEDLFEAGILQKYFIYPSKIICNFFLKVGL